MDAAVFPEMPPPAELAAEQSILGLLRKVFWSEPGATFLAELDAATADADREDGGLGLMRSEIRAHQAQLDNYAESLAVEFARLFIGPRPPPAIPYASFYLSPNKTLMSDTTIAVRNRYLEADVAVQQLGSIPDDHIAIELEFLYLLTQRTIAALEQQRRDEAERWYRLRDDFVQAHLLKWLPQFVENLSKAAEMEYFRGAALLLEEIGVVLSSSED